MKNAIVLFLIWLYAPAYGQDYLVYHTYINKAESFLVDDNADSAYYYYDKAFSEYDFVFVKDAFIAAELAYKKKDGVHLYKYLIKGASVGLTAECLFNYDYFSGLKEASVYVRVRIAMDSAYEVYRNNYHNKELAQQWVDKFNTKEDADSNGTPSEQRVLAAENIAALKEIMKTKGFPGEKLLGPFWNCNDMANYNAVIMLLDYDCAMAEMYDELWEAVKKGELHPRDFAAIAEFELEKARLQDGIRPILNEACYKKIKPRGFYFQMGKTRYDPARTAEAEANRKKYYLCDIATDRKKYILHKNGEYVFNFGRVRL